jgi:hypothetical protein
VKAARAAAAEALEALERAKAIRNALVPKVNSARSDLDDATSVLHRAVADVVRADPAVARLLADYEVADRARTNLRRALHFLDGRHVLPNDDWNAADHPARWSDLPGERPWAAAFDALRSDADAELPV